MHVCACWHVDACMHVGKYVCMRIYIHLHVIRALGPPGIEFELFSTWLTFLFMPAAGFRLRKQHTPAEPLYACDFVDAPTQGQWSWSPYSAAVMEKIRRYGLVGRLRDLRLTQKPNIGSPQPDRIEAEISLGHSVTIPVQLHSPI